ncbi:hypothetical protein DFH28DRAFT_1137428 [Melampsora americana]|nr:hypothetical protein DFH28DRAFT_1137428 [Melampsora americana]
MPTTPLCSPTEKRLTSTLRITLSFLTRRMVNRKLSNVPLPSHGRIDIMSCALRSRSYQPFGQNAGRNCFPSKTFTPTLPRSRLIFPSPGSSTMPPSLTAPSMINGDHTALSPFKGPSKRLNPLNSSTSPLMKGHPHGPTPSTASPTTVHSGLSCPNSITGSRTSKKWSATVLEKGNDDDKDELPQLNMAPKENVHADTDEEGEEDAFVDLPPGTDCTRSFQVTFNYWQLVVPPEPELSKRHKNTTLP